MITKEIAHQIKAEIEKFQPQWTRKGKAISDLYGYVDGNKNKPHTSSEWYKSLWAAFQRNPAFRKYAKKKRPHWFITSKESRSRNLAEVKKRLIKLAKSGLPKPSTNARDGDYLSSFRCKTSSIYDKDFRSLIEKERPDWFFGFEHRVALLIKLAAEGGRPMNGSPERSTFRYLVASPGRFKYALRQLKRLRPDWFKNWWSVRKEERAEEVINKIKAGLKITKRDRDHLYDTCKKSVYFTEKVRLVSKTFFRNWKHDCHKNKIMTLLEAGGKRPHQRTALGAWLNVELRRDSKFKMLVKKKCPSWLGIGGRGRLNVPIGSKFARWTIVREASQKKYISNDRRSWVRRFLCRCECGTIKTQLLPTLRSGLSKSCGCIQFKDLSGKVFYSWTVIKKVTGKWMCRCICGSYGKATTTQLKKGLTKSCGCRRTGHKKT